MRAYLTVWRLPSAPVLLLSGFAGRLPSAMVPLALLLMVQQQTGSYAVAGLASATLGIAMAVMAPVLGRLADRRGPRGVLFAEAAALPADARRCSPPSSWAGRPTAAVIAASAAAGRHPAGLGHRPRAVVARRPRRPAHRLRARRHRDRARLRRRPDRRSPPSPCSPRPALAVAVAGVLAVGGALGIATSGAMRAWVPAPAARSRPAHHRARPRHAAGAAQRLGADARLRRPRGRRPGVRRRGRLARAVRRAAGRLVAGLGRRRALVRRPRGQRLAAAAVPAGACSA